MADGEEEQFSLCWNNYNTNLSTGFHESLLKGDLVDVTLAAEGHLVKAHRLVLSVCSPYFQKMFTQMPANQHAFVFLKDVPHAALKDLIQFMYCGEVNVKQDALPTFISTAEALQIKGLTENGDSQSVPASQTPSTQTHVPIKATSTPANVVQTQRPRTVQQRNVNRTASYKLDSEDSSDDKATTVVVQQTQKRVLPRAGAPVPTSAKRLKTISADPLEQPETPTRSTVGQSSSVQQGPSAQIVQVTSAADVGKNVGEPEFIDLPIETVPTKAEPDYGDEGEMEEAGDTEATYVEDESYGDMKYDESYFTESEETGKGASASGFGESYTEGDTSANEAQVIRSVNISYETSPRGNPILVLNYNRYVRNRESKKRVFWRCTKYYQSQVSCPGSVAISKPDANGSVSINTTRAHNEICDMLREQNERRIRSRAPRSASNVDPLGDSNADKTI
ncbi:modifier of mdg4-like isoform X17 [Sitodiplosis mosellana]|uniref:modifier of mdg4-like isoform X17 n=1 Tax=Sitodiplosis mosellana TaxID=263140 RepID=UPI002443BF16|nr:modifier of mdg4-like isoform X17 [Sitodiplosis mosellana]